VINWGRVDELISQGYISCRKHPTEDLFIYNYTNQAQFDGKWTLETIQCRGLITDINRKVIARPFKKFFSLEQLEGLRNYVHHLYGLKWKEIGNLQFKSYEKADGSLIISFRTKSGALQLATRGSFASEQAIKANEIWQKKYSDTQLLPEFTYLFEIIYKENRIVVNYGDMEDLVLIGIVRIEDGWEAPYDAWPLYFREYDVLPPFAERYLDINKLEHLKNLDNDSRFKDKEGVVLHFENGFKLKHKLLEYKNLHRILSGFSKKDVLENIVGGTIEEYLKLLPDEFYEQGKKWHEEFLDQYNQLESKMGCVYTILKIRMAAKSINTRKEVALWLNDRDISQTIKGAIFSALDGKGYRTIFWKKIKEDLKNEVFNERLLKLKERINNE